MRPNNRLLAVISLMTLAAILWGCDSPGLLEPGSARENERSSSEKELNEDEGAWQTVELIACQTDEGMMPEQAPAGHLRYHLVQDLVFEGQIAIRDLLPDSEYLLAIVGKPDLPGSPEEYYRAGVVFYDDDAPPPYTGRPTQPGGSRGEQEYCDFALVITDQHGGLEESLCKRLPCGIYDVTFLVKDAHLWTHYAEFGDFDTAVLGSDQVGFQIKAQLQTTEF